ncbi:4a-hydroxytetrahydrobiopterin dehydratase [Nonomuraea maritima]|jgi:4a-hydroxytetrahydrobiopterin dehydratase|uniref:Putative pterin-4-alpha-carbinolamine dehydratase n=1 Tax=Nonomuraea maritima TaxID=683260 RepID=A0A1G8V1Q5_9ACTN|nr:4a-hydroxytetrahydrobiopterin dehydratase [Nonomuraea maritima]SDJ59787.1 4a-hydroxytetrahydrobiopterin dehydratase [Nonomuraea maritima]
MDVASKLKDLPAWRREGDEIRRTVEAPDFPTAIRIVDEVAVRAEELNHHPDIDIRWRTLHLALTTHDAGGLTDLDFTLAAVIDGIAAKHGA